MDQKLKLAQQLYQDSRQPIFFCDKELRLIWQNEAATMTFREYQLEELSQLCLISDTDAVTQQLAQEGSCHLTGNPMLDIESITLTAFDGENDGFMIGLPTIRSGQLLNADLQQIVSVILAQFREPMFAIHNMLSPLKYKLEQLECYDDYKFLRDISSNCYKTLRTVSNLTNYSRYIDPKVEMQWELLDVDRFLADLCGSIGKLVRRTEIGFAYRQCEETVISRIDSGKLSIAILNLVANSCLYTRPGNEILITLQKLQNDLVITVTDQGLGMRPAVQARAFDPFYSYDENGSPACGVGLGLSIVKQVVGMHGGSCVLTSEVDRGTTVALRIPIVEAENELMVESVCEGYILQKFSPLFLYLADICSINMIDSM